MKPSLAFFALLGLLLFAETIAARKAPEEGSNDEMKEKTMPQADKSFLKDFDPNRPQSSVQLPFSRSHEECFSQGFRSQPSSVQLPVSGGHEECFSQGF
ncbi:hypothetical protein GQ457_06G002370 [Hibiscus cannabinus]